MATGHLEKRSKSGWTIVIDFGKDVNYQRNRKYITVLGNRKSAEKELIKILNEINTGSYVEPTATKIGEYLVWWLEQHHKSKDLAPKTLESYRSIIDVHLIPSLGEIPISKLQPFHIQSFVNKALDHNSPRTIAYCLTILKQALKHAMTKWRMINFNPADAIEMPRYKKTKFKVLSPEEVRRFLEAASDHQDYPMIYTALFTGMRRSELLGLKWEDIDIPGRALHVRRQLQRIVGIGFITKAPKTEAGQRQVALPDSVIVLFKRMKVEQAESRLKIGYAWQDHGYVFCLQDGSPLDPSNFSRRFHKLAVKVGHPDLRFHDLRHTHASLLLMSGEEITVVQERLGHEKPTTTAAIYAHAIPGRQREVADRFDAILGTKKSL